jgi:hypothetical protein
MVFSHPRAEGEEKLWIIGQCATRHNQGRLHALARPPPLRFAANHGGADFCPIADPEKNLSFVKTPA